MEPLPTGYTHLADLGRSFGPRRIGWQTRTPLATSTPIELDRITRFAGEHLDVAAVCATMVDGEGRLVVSCHGIAVPTALLVTHALRRHLKPTRSPLVVPDASLDPRMSDSPTVRDGTVRACVGMSLRGDDGGAIGSLVVMDRKPRRWAQPELDYLQNLSVLIMRHRPPADPRYPPEPVGPAFARGSLDVPEKRTMTR